MKTRWESCVFIVLMLLPGAWLLNTSLGTGASTVFSLNRSGAAEGTKANHKSALAAAAPRHQEITRDWRLDMHCRDAAHVPAFRVHPDVDNLPQKASAQQDLTKEH